MYDTIVELLDALNQANAALREANANGTKATTDFRAGFLLRDEYTAFRQIASSALASWEVAVDALEDAIVAAPVIEDDPSSQGNLF